MNDTPQNCAEVVLPYLVNLPDNHGATVNDLGSQTHFSFKFLVS